MKVGTAVWLDRPARDAARIASAAEQAGFDALWVPDHYFLRDSFVALALAAEATSTIKLGTAVASPLLRHPAQLGASFATLQEMSEGRVIVGLGPGGAEFHTELGLPIRRPLSLIEESVDIIRGLGDGRVDVSGNHFEVSGAKLRWDYEPMPVFMAGRGPKMLQLSGRIADGVITHGLARSHIEYVAKKVAAGEAQADRGGACEIIYMFVHELDDDRATALDRLRSSVIYMVGGSYSEELIPIYGLDPDEVLPIREVTATGDLDRAAAMMTPQMIEAFNVGGSEYVLLKRLTELAELGVESVILQLGGDTVDEAIARTERVGRVIRELS
ncbi:MAG: LLM class flavin-dependent oxidoreductase [Acidimicrobiia bacterium]|nr:LLM class flavin-dependent oxidoreductase [Acidimicrobiia bacterium]